jgi:hypothetical protein
MRGMLATIQFRVFCLPVSNLRTLSLTLKEEHRLGALENRVVRRIFEPKREEEVGGWRRLQSERLHNFYASPNILE